jgi:hypothetical protein
MHSYCFVPKQKHTAHILIYGICYNLMGRDRPEPMFRPLWVAGPIWSCDKNNYPRFELDQIMG